MSCRIDFMPQPGGGRVIDRTFPGILSGRISDGEWTSLCDKIDVVIAPVAEFRARAARSIKCIGLMQVVAFALIVAYSTLYTPSSTLGFMALPLFFICFGFILPGCYFTRTMRPMMAQAQEIENEMQSILQTETNKRYDVSFHYRKDKTNSMGGYIECSAGNVGNAGGTMTMTNPSLMEQGVASTYTSPTSMFSSLTDSSAMYGTGQNQNTAERLKELEGIKALISEEEYNTKRQQILNNF